MLPVAMISSCLNYKLPLIMIMVASVGATINYGYPTGGNPRNVLQEHAHRMVELSQQSHCSVAQHSKHIDGYHHVDKRSIMEPEEFLVNNGEEGATITGKFGNAFYFNGSDQSLKLTDSAITSEPVTLPRESFSLEVWLKPEGGQYESSIIFDVSDACSDDISESTWQLGIRSRSSDGDKAAHFFFSLQTEMARERTVVWSVKPYRPRQWTHITVTYDGNELRLYVNSARVALSRAQAGPLFADLRSSCKHLFLGGIVSKKKTKQNVGRYRGAIDEFRLWKRVISQTEIVRNLFANSGKTTTHDLPLISDSFESFDQWTSIGESLPLSVVSDIKPSVHHAELSIPPCGQTICDNPNIVMSYASNVELRKMKSVRYRVVNIMNNDGTNPIVSEKQITDQHEHLNVAFSVYNISFLLEIVRISSTSLRRKTIVFSCDSSKIGNKQCNLECRHPITGNDGGDCDETIYECDQAMLHNHVCNQVCNRPEFNWDNGDCCNATNPNVYRECIDPTSPLRGYIGIDEYKRILNMSNDQALTITFAEWSNDELIGLSTFPWEKDVYSIQGGIVLQPTRFGVPNHRDNLIHEVGHALGLWHVHHGVSEMNCDDTCREHDASLLTGDLVGDTKPTPKNTECRDPSPFSSKSRSFEASCLDRKEFTDTPFNNYMSYADESCTDHFTAHQVARMHCYLDLKYKGWIVEDPNQVIPLPPRVVRSSSAPNPSLTITWLPPLGDLFCVPEGSVLGQAQCTRDGRIIQYAAKASSPGPFKMSEYWAPHQATGPPDADSCEASTKAWLPDTPSCGNPGNCVLELEFEIPVVSESLSLWVAWNAANGVKLLKLVFEDSTFLSLENIPTYCDMPFTLNLFERRRLHKVEIHTATPFVSIDAIQIISTSGQNACNSCEWLKYRVLLSPHFGKGVKFFETYDRSFTDHLIEPGTTYRYQIQTINSSKVSGSSPTLYYQFQQPFCGNGKVDIQLNETCDDGNVMDDDGCSSECKLEAMFHCVGEPSACYIYAGDGICESFEELRSVEDCGHYTPPGYIDTWAVLAITEEGLNKHCPTMGILGPPKVDGCRTNFDSKTAWQPCTSFKMQNMWIKLFFEHPVVATSVIIHLASDGITEFNSDPKILKLDLLSTDNQYHSVAHAESKLLSCKSNPVEYPILHDLSKPYFYTQAVVIYLNSHNVAISAVRLRSFQNLDPPALAQCAASDQLYNPKSRRCADSKKCVRSICDKLSIDKAYVKCTGYEDGDSCTVKCADGFIPSETGAVAFKVHCFNGQWSRPTVQCKPIDCRLPKLKYAEFTCPEGTELGKSCAFTCRPPAKLKGSNTTITCGNRGLWSIAEAYCQLSCAAPAEPSRYTKSISRQCKLHYQPLSSNSLSYPMGAKCKFYCRPGYYVEGQGLTKRYFRKTCGEGGVWIGPKCVAVTCPKPNVIYNDLYNCTHGYKVGSECSFQCPGKPDVQKSTCQANGTWTVAEPCDLPKTPCQAPIAPRAFGVGCPSRNLFVGSSCGIRCNAYGYEPVSQSIVRTETGLKLQVLQNVPKVTCTVHKTWEPDMHSLACVKQCTKEFIGDGWCDFQNNRGYCGWDGGDCCSSTAKGRKVRLMFPSLCTSHLCQCLDPYAIENRNDLQMAKLMDHASAMSTIAANEINWNTTQLLQENDVEEPASSYVGVSTSDTQLREETMWKSNGSSSDEVVQESFSTANNNELQLLKSSGSSGYSDSAKYLDHGLEMTNAALMDTEQHAIITSGTMRMQNLIYILTNSTDLETSTANYTVNEWLAWEEISRKYKQHRQLSQMRNLYFRRIHSSIIRALQYKYKELLAKS